MFRRAVALFVLLACCLAGPTYAQNRLAAEVGPLFPVGDFSNSYGPSLFVGARFEFQNVNAIGGVAVLSFELHGGFAALNLDEEVKTAFEQAGQSTGSNLVNAGGGVRVYSAASPVFFSLGASFLSFNVPGDADTENGGEVALGIGFSWGTPAVVAELEVKGHAAFFSNDDIQYVTLRGNVGIPF